ncbi:MAG TPA: efflux RND transporter periplasmic adaptor subunit [Gemmataceae bacterium]|nr:efflux RND transporter periplasmic adaptor subunit [Gemmataceae bacterium]
MKSILTSQGALHLSVALVVVLGLLCGGFAIFHHGVDKAAAGFGEPEGDEVKEAEIPVKTVHPRFDKTFTMTEKRPADVWPYFETDLVTRVPGYIEWMPYDVGSEVKAGEPLVRVSVPDLVARCGQREADWEYAKKQVDQKAAAIKVAEANFKAAKARIDAAKARENAAKAWLSYRQKQRERYYGLLKDRAIDAKLVDEQEDEYKAAFQALNADQEKVISAREDANAAEARIKQATAEWEETKALVKVKKAEFDYEKAMLDYASIEAPYDGVIVRRNVKVSPGFFVQNAGDGHAVPLLTIQRNDIVTVVMRLPDVYASYITPETEAIFETPSLPGVKIHGKVTRYPPSLVNPEHDRTMLVEVDLWNRSLERMKEKLNDPKFRDTLKKGMPGDPNGGLPVVPHIEGKLAAGREMQLLPGYFGEMTLVLRKFDNVFMLPSSAIINKGGYSYIYVVKEGKTQLQPVKVQVDDGKLVNIELLDKDGVVIGDLTGKEEVIISNQGELSEGQPVKPVLVKDWGSVVPGGDHNEKH